MRQKAPIRQGIPGAPPQGAPGRPPAALHTLLPRRRHMGPQRPKDKLHPPPRVPPPLARRTIGYTAIYLDQCILQPLREQHLQTLHMPRHLALSTVDGGTGSDHSTAAAPLPPPAEPPTTHYSWLEISL